ncbi:hypothetical protein AOB60_24255 [Streptomyces noursei]|uniref:Secreted protein n=1 Tax=Streptomyces noursei TaxID=1971 RepID=A0A2N8P8S8_STRNR|nr:hypothetical protein AOB60_24255 [Streptomyces noursei]
MKNRAGPPLAQAWVASLSSAAVSAYPTAVAAPKQAARKLPAPRRSPAPTVTKITEPQAIRAGTQRLSGAWSRPAVGAAAASAVPSPTTSSPTPAQPHREIRTGTGPPNSTRPMSNANGSSNTKIG